MDTGQGFVESLTVIGFGVATVVSAVGLAIRAFWHRVFW